MKLNICFVCLLSLLSVTMSFANTNNGTDPSNITNDDLEQLFFNDPEHNIWFIDFEILDNPISLIELKKEGKVIFSDSIDGSTKNTIYELDLKAYGKGEFVIELVINGEIVKKNISI